MRGKASYCICLAIYSLPSTLARILLSHPFKHHIINIIIVTTINHHQHRHLPLTVSRYPADPIKLGILSFPTPPPIHITFITILITTTSTPAPHSCSDMLIHTNHHAITLIGRFQRNMAAVEETYLEFSQIPYLVSCCLGSVALIRGQTIGVRGRVETPHLAPSNNNHRNHRSSRLSNEITAHANN